MSARTAIVGAAETGELGKLPHRSELSLHTESALLALADAGLTPADVDGVAAAGLSPIEVAHSLGIAPGWIDSTNVGGCSFLLHVRHAAAAIAAGHASTVLITHGESGRSRVGHLSDAPAPTSMRGQFEVTFGATGPATLFTLPALRYMHAYGLTEEQLAMVAVIQRQWASRTPRALMRELITVADVLASRMIAYPFHLLECCLITDGGGALVLVSAERAADLAGRAVYLLGSGEAAETPVVSQLADLTASQAFRRAGAAAFAEARLGPADVDHLMAYDAFAHVPLYGLEALGFVGPGEAGAFVAEGNTGPGGRLPMNTNGGGLSYTHTGMYGMFAIQEAVRQLRGTAAAQVPDPHVSMVLAVGGIFTSAGALLLSDQPG